MKVIVMCGKYDDFDPKIDKKWISSTTFQLAANGNGFQPKFWQKYE